MVTQKKHVNYKWTVRKAVLDGTIQKPDCCSRCDRTDQRICGHHPDYSKPLEVEWLCSSCHVKLHHKQRRLLNIKILKPRHKDGQQTLSRKGHKRVWLPILEKSPFVRSGLLRPKQTPDEHRYFEQSFNWEKLLEKLSCTQRRVIMWRYGFVDGQGRTFREVSEIIKTSYQRVQQIEERAMEKLRFIMKKEQCF